MEHTIKCSRCEKNITEKAKICVPCFVELSTQTPLEAAAPDLLEACKGMVEDAELLQEDEAICACQCLAKAPDDFTSPPPCNYCKAKAAIAKAKKE